MRKIKANAVGTRTQARKTGGHMNGRAAALQLKSREFMQMWERFDALTYETSEQLSRTRTGVTTKTAGKELLDHPP